MEQLTNEQLDDLILALATRGPLTAHAAMCEAERRGGVSHDGFYYRAVDRSLQRLRKRGLIRFEKKQWHATGKP